MRWDLLRVSVASLVLACASAGCGDDDHIGAGGLLVGAACRDDFDCASECARGGDFPDGTCTLACRNDLDCPGGTFCIDKQGGICLLACGIDAHCRPGYHCKHQKNRGGGDSDVCIK
jgi:hypothetical protein